jgi:transcriptional repressor NrdR
MRRFTTFETVDLTLQVKKRDGTFDDFSQEKLILGMDSACRHTRVSHDEVRAMASQIKLELMARGVREIESRELGEIVMRHLQEKDVVAYIRFACVYKRFKDIEELSEEIRTIVPRHEQEDEVNATEKK